MILVFLTCLSGTATVLWKQICSVFHTSFFQHFTAGSGTGIALHMTVTELTDKNTYPRLVKNSFIYLLCYFFLFLTQFDHALVSLFFCCCFFGYCWNLHRSLFLRTAFSVALYYVPQFNNLLQYSKLHISCDGKKWIAVIVRKELKSDTMVVL